MAIPNSTINHDEDGINVVDGDGDGVIDTLDAFPNDPSETADTDGDGTGDNADTDIDGNGINDDQVTFPKVSFTKGSTKKAYNNTVTVIFARDVVKWDYSTNGGKTFTVTQGNKEAIIKLTNGKYYPSSIIVRCFNVLGNMSSVMNSGLIVIASSKEGFPLPNTDAFSYLNKRKAYAFTRAAM